MLKTKKLSQFKKQMQKVVLGAAEKKAVKENLIAYMNMHPVRENTSGRLKSQTRRTILFFNTQNMYAKIATLLILLSGTGTAFAAENTVPGDPLYPVKVHINEPVRGALAVGTEAKANWSAEVAERRLDEADKLAAKGKLTADVEANLEARFTAQTQKVQDTIKKLQEAGKTEVASDLSTRLESAIQIHSQILDKINSDDATSTSTPQNIKPLIQQLRTDVKSLHDIKIKLDGEVKTKLGPDVKIAAQNHMDVALKQIERAKTLLESKDITSTSSAQTKLVAAQKAFDEGKVEFDAGNFNAAFISFGNAQRLAAEVRVMTHVENDLKIDERVHKIFDHLDEKGINLSDEQKNDFENQVKGKIEHKVENRVGEIEHKFDGRVEKFKENHPNINLNLTSTTTVDTGIHL